LTVDSNDEYNGLGQLVKSTTYESNGEVQHYSVYEYGINGNRARAATYNSDNILIAYLLYDADGRATERRNYNLDGTLYMQTVFEYDDRGDISEIIAFDANGNEISRVIHSGY